MRDDDDAFFAALLRGSRSARQGGDPERFYRDLLGLPQPSAARPRRAANLRGSEEAPSEEAPSEQAPPPVQVPLGRVSRLTATGSPLPVGAPAYTWTSANPNVASLTRIGTPQTHPSAVDVRGVTPGTTTVSVTYRSTTRPPSTTTWEIVVPTPTLLAVDRYGCHDLRRGDMDADPANANRPRWGGRAGAAATLCRGGTTPTNPQHVRQLQEDLRTLGFSIVGVPSGVFDRNTEWALRELQIYAKMDLVARIRDGAPANLRRGAHLVAGDNNHDVAGNLSEYVASLVSTANTMPYVWPVSGVLNAATRAILDHWLRNDWRCPVVIEAWSVNRAGARTAPVAVNIWAHDSHASARERIFVRDFTNYYVYPTGRDPNAMHVIGDYVTYMTWSGPRSVPAAHTWSQGELLPAALTGVAAPAGASLSTFRVVRSVAEVECIGFFDSVNCYDNAFVSVGPCHWTLGIVSGTTVSEGELCGYLAYLRHIDPDAFRRAVEFFGARVDEDWVSSTGVANGASLYSAGSRKYAGWMALQQESGGFARLAANESEGNYFKTWHWHHRFVMAGRTIEGYRRRMWDMARVRIRDILAVPWGAGVAEVGAGTPTARPARIGDVLTSERSVAMLLRWHIRFPANVVSGGTAGARLRNVVTLASGSAATLTWTGDPTGWTNAHETALVAAIVAAAPTGVRATLETVRDWPTWLGGANPRGFTLAAPIAAALSAARGSFAFDASDLPPAPP